ncbi:hypothetical protein FRB99_007543 [Tulasnella sp. 403]|nr:hypothetical protein FRB99_007543 [Tulasnella sp. 403]
MVPLPITSAPIPMQIARNSGNLPFYQYLNHGAIILAVLLDKARPPLEPVTSPSGQPYGLLWALAIKCWDEVPENRPQMDEIVRNLTLRVQTILDDSDATPAPSASIGTGGSSPSLRSFDLVEHSENDDTVRPFHISDTVDDLQETVHPAPGPGPAAILPFEKISGPKEGGNRTDDAQLSRKKSSSSSPFAGLYDKLTRRLSRGGSRIKLTNGLAVVMNSSYPIDVSGAYDLFCTEDASSQQKVALKRFRLADTGHVDQQRRVTARTLIMPPSTAPPSDLEIDGKVEITSDTACASGGFGVLLRGTHTVYGDVALKRLRNLTDEERRLFVLEARTWQALSHPNILKFLGTCTLSAELYLVSPYQENGSLLQYIRNNPDANRPKFIYEIATALEYLHDINVIHGDIKAQNILVSPDPHALVCDFGLSRPTTVETDLALKGVGSVPWQSPELFHANSHKSTKSDVYAFGIMISEVLSGNTPFGQYPNHGSIVVAVFIAKERPPLEPMTSPSGESYGLLWALATKCWDEEPENRPGMDEIVSRLALRVQTILEDPEATPIPSTSVRSGESSPSFYSLDLDEHPGNDDTVRPVHVSEVVDDLQQTARPVLNTAVVLEVESPKPLVEEPLPVLYDLPHSRSLNTVSPNEKFSGPKGGGHRVDGVQVLGHKKSGSFGGRFAEIYDRFTRRRAYDLFCVEDVSGQQKVALKRFRLADMGHVDQQRRAIQVVCSKLQTLSHAHVLAIMGTGVDDHKLLYIASPWVGLSTLTTYIPQFPDCNKQQVLQDVADGLRYLHASHVIHGDIRPQNIIVSTDGRAIINDSGLAELMPSTISAGVQRLDALRFQAPELYNGAHRSYRSDVYSFGLTIYQVLSGRTPFEQYTTFLPLLEAVATRGERPVTVPAFSRKREPYSSFWKIARKCWQEDPDERPPMREVFYDLKRWPN